jgi:hypothetical protein
MPKVIKGRGACQEIVMENPDITKLRSLPAGQKMAAPL